MIAIGSEKVKKQNALQHLRKKFGTTNTFGAKQLLNQFSKSPLASRYQSNQSSLERSQPLPRSNSKRPKTTAAFTAEPNL